MKTAVLSILISFLALFSACDGLQKTEVGDKKSKSKKDGLVKQFYKNGKIRSAINYKGGRKNGLAISYYKDGTPKQEIEYVEDKKHGVAKTYYENGKLFQKTPYENGVKHGVREKYRQNGKLMAEIPYHNGKACKGLKEYLLNGKPKKQYPVIKIQAIDKLIQNNRYILKVKMSDDSKSVKFYKGSLTDGCLGEGLLALSTPTPGVLELVYNMPPGTFTMEELNFIAETKTKLGNPYIVQKKYNLAIENRGY